MITKPAEFSCAVCGARATTRYRCTDKASDYPVCWKHQREIQNPSNHFEYFDSIEWEAFAARWLEPPESLKRQRLEEDAYELNLLGAECAMTYCLSELTKINHFALWTSEILANCAEYVAARTSPLAAVFFHDTQSLMGIEPYLRREFELSRGNAPKPTRRDRALELLLHHPDWTNAQIAAETPTTVAQMDRWVEITLLRKMQRLAPPHPSTSRFRET